VVERKLTAILATDVAGFSRLVGVDEEGTIARLSSHRRTLIDPKIKKHHGRIVKTTGDGMLIEFASAVDAVRCAAEIQRAMVDRNASVPEEARITFRAGINVGDIVVEGDDILGDGVNIAARLEGLAEPGSICISEDAYRQIRDKLPLPFTDQGEQTLKNIARPVRVYALSAEAVASLPETPMSADAPSPPGKRSGSIRRIGQALAAAVAVFLAAGVVLFALKPTKGPQPFATVPRFSIVVLPFTSLNGDASQDYLADVITDELTTGLSRIRGSFVIARSTAFTYKGKAVDVKQIAQDLGVRYVLEGSEQQGGNRMRVNAQLISAETAAHLWADQFDTDRADLLTMQDEIVTRLARALQIQLVEVDAARVDRTHPGNLDAEDLAMRCEVVLVNSRSGANEESGYSLCEHALRLDERNVRALVDLSFKFISRVIGVQSTDRESDIRKADELVSRALAIDPNAYGAHFAKAEVLLAQKRFEEAIVEAERSLALNPSFVNAYSGLCIANSFLGRPEKSVEYADKAIRLSPRDPLLHVFYLEKGFALSLMDEDGQAIEWLRGAVATAPEWPLPQAMLAAALAATGHEAEAHETLRRYLSLSGVKARTIAQWKAQMPSDNPVFLAHAGRLLEGLRKAGMPEE
jgi:adenylate cyclase